MAHRPPRGGYDVSSTAPHAARKLKRNPFGPVLKLALVIAAPPALLSVFGQPALRIEYVWNGNVGAPVYSKCLYITAFEGWKTVYPARAVNNCPLLETFPFSISALIGG